MILIKECKSCKLWFNPAQDIDECPYCGDPLVITEKSVREVEEYNARMQDKIIEQELYDRRN